MGRSLTNTMINTGIETEFEEAIYEVKCVIMKVLHDLSLYGCQCGA